MPRAVASALTAVDYVVGVGARWTPQAGLAVLSEIDRARLPLLIAEAQLAMDCDQEWLANRLTVLWLSTGHRKSEAQATAWLSETVRLLAAVPTDILATAIDQAVMSSERGFLPTVGEILKIAEPALERRRQALRRMQVMADTVKAAMTCMREPAPPICSPEEAADILKESGFGHVVQQREQRDAGQAARAEPTVEDYMALGISRAEAVQAMLDRSRMLSRGRARGIGAAATSVIADASAALEP